MWKLFRLKKEKKSEEVAEFLKKISELSETVAKLSEQQSEIEEQVSQLSSQISQISEKVFENSKKITVLIRAKEIKEEMDETLEEKTEKYRREISEIKPAQPLVVGKGEWYKVVTMMKEGKISSQDRNFSFVVDILRILPKVATEEFSLHFKNLVDVLWSRHYLQGFSRQDYYDILDALLHLTDVLKIRHQYNDPRKPKTFYVFNPDSEFYNTHH
jgi:citrate synthase